MAVIGKIRKHSGLLIVVIGVALAAFVLGDLAKTQSSGPNNVGEINGDEITYKDFSSRLEFNVENEKGRTGKTNLSATELFYLREQTWKQIVSEKLMGEEFEELGITVSSEELFDLIQGNNPHAIIRQYFTDPATGQYDKDAVLGFLQTLDQQEPATIQQWLNLESNIKDSRRYEKFGNLVTKGYYIPEALAEFEYVSGNKVASVKLLAKKYADISDELVEVTEDDLKSYYNNNTDLYQLNDEVRGIDYVIFDVQPSVEDRVETTNQVNDLFEEFKTTSDVFAFVNAVSDDRYDSTFYKKGDLPIALDEKLFDAPVGTFIEPYIDNDVFSMARLMEVQYRPDSMKANQILFAYQGAYGSQVMRSKDEAKLMADSIATVLRRNSNKFNEIASTLSDDPTAKDNGGDTGFFPDMGMIYQFNEAVLTGGLGEILVVETVFGYHVIEVIAKKGFNKKIRVAVVNRAIEPSSETFQDYWTMASKFAAETETAEDFELAINKLGQRKRSMPSLTKATNFIPDVDYPRTVVRWAFENEVEVGSISQIFDFDGKYVVAMVTKVDEEGTQPFEAVRDLVFAEVNKIKKAEYIKSQINGLTSLDAIAEKMQVKVEPVDVNLSSSIINLYGLEPEVVGQAFGLNKGEISEVIQGNGAVYVVSTLEFKNPEATSSIALTKAQMKAYFENRVRNNMILTALENAADLEDNRHSFY
jgi:peptidyl-prolyl cis-trans isomerase D